MSKVLSMSKTRLVRVLLRNPYCKAASVDSVTEIRALNITTLLECRRRRSMPTSFVLTSEQLFPYFSAGVVPHELRCNESMLMQTLQKTAY